MHKALYRVYRPKTFGEVVGQEHIVKTLKNQIKNKIRSIYYVETLAKYFDEKKNKHIKNIELRCNLTDLINDLDYLKQYLYK